MKILNLLILLLCSFFAKGITVKNFPLAKQFFTRNQANTATVSIEILNDSTTSGNYSLIVSADSNLYFYQKLDIPSNESREISVVLTGGLVQYNFELFYHQSSGDSSLVKSSKEILCGDAFVIYGQSNGSALFGLEEYSQTIGDKWARNFMLWEDGKEEWFNSKLPDSRVGVLGLSIANSIIKRKEIPVCVINGSVGGERLANLGFRNEENPADRKTYYGDLLARLNAASSIKSLAGFIWFQGEAETSSGLEEIYKYEERLDSLYHHIIADYVPIEHFIVMQINLLKDGFGEAGIIRNAQSDMGSKYEKVTSLATVGQTFYYDGVHYAWQGYVTLANMITSFFEHNYYATEKDLSYSSPSLKKAAADTTMGVLRLIFDEYHEVSLKEYNERPYGRRDINPFVFINGNNYQIESISAKENEIWLKIKNLEDAKTITFLPSDFSDENSNFYDGPVIKNQHGFSALTFYDAKIQIESFQNPDQEPTENPDQEPTETYEKEFYINKKKSLQAAGNEFENCRNCKLKYEPTIDLHDELRKKNEQFKH